MDKIAFLVKIELLRGARDYFVYLSQVALVIVLQIRSICVYFFQKEEEENEKQQVVYGSCGKKKMQWELGV